jgi:hypothetical protein
MRTRHLFIGLVIALLGISSGFLSTATAQSPQPPRPQPPGAIRSATTAVMQQGAAPAAPSAAQAGTCIGNSTYSIYSGSSLVYGGYTSCDFVPGTIGVQSRLYWFDEYVLFTWVEVSHVPPYGPQYCSGLPYCSTGEFQGELISGYYYVGSTHYCSSCVPSSAPSSTASFYMSGY